MNRAIFFLLILLNISASAQNNCSVTNKTFKTGEQLTFKIYYNWGAIWMAAGEASCAVQSATVAGKPVYHFISYGTTYSKYDWFYKVRDKYESYADSATLRPLRFTREVHEGGNYNFDDYVFNARKNKIYSASRKNKGTTKLDSINITPCTNDVLTAIYYARCIDFSKYKIKDSIPITFVLDGQNYPSYVRYLGTETIKDEFLGTVRCIKFRPRLIEGTIFKGGEGMTVWVTDDENRMPLYVETPIVIGSIKAYLINYSGLRNKMNCKEIKK
ncbi:MAG: DUF3108 domain-containing protein [Bacteroidota bacterium]